MRASQSCDGSQYTLPGAAASAAAAGGTNDITGLSVEPAHYQLLSELGER